MSFPRAQDAAIAVAITGMFFVGDIPILLFTKADLWVALLVFYAGLAAFAMAQLNRKPDADGVTLAAFSFVLGACYGVIDLSWLAIAAAAPGVAGGLFFLFRDVIGERG